MAFNNLIVIFVDDKNENGEVILSAEDKLQDAIMNHQLETPWVAYVNGTMVYPDSVVVEREEVNMFDSIKEILPVLCTEEEYEVLLTNGEGTITDPRTQEETYVTYNPNLYYYTYDASELE